MTTTSPVGDALVVVDGSNIATEGRSLPSLAQLNEAVMAFTQEFSDVSVTVVVDATFGHRIDKSEVAEFDEAIAHNELVAPPAGAVGRGDAFVLSIANKVGARILSNDSFQEFHGQYDWLFDEGRLIGGKPVPFVGWVFVPRLPVKGAVSRRARAEGGSTNRRTASKAASLPMPVPKAPPPRRQPASGSAPVDEPSRDDRASSGRGGRRGSSRRGPSGDGQNRSNGAMTAPDSAVEEPTRPVTGGPVNDLLPFLEFVEHHPVGTAVTGVVESYSSHGAYVRIKDLLGYVPLRLMGDPTPRSARSVMKIGETVTLVVASFAPGRRSVDLTTAAAADAPPSIDVVASGDPASEAIAAAATKTPRARSAKKSAAMQTPVDTPSTEKKRAASKAPADKAAAGKAPARKAAAKKTAAKKAPAEKALARPATAASASQATARKVAADKAPAKKAPAERSPAKTSPATKTPAKKAPAKKAPAKKAPAKQAPAKKAPAKQAPAKQAPAKKASAKKAPAKKAPAKKAPAKKAPAKKAPATGRSRES